MTDQVSFEVTGLTNAHEGSVILVVLGGPSGGEWKKVRDQVNPNVIVGVNGVNSQIQDLDYWLCIENMRHSAKMAKQEERYRLIMEMFQRTGPKIRLVNQNSVHLLKNRSNVVTVHRGYGKMPCDLPQDFSLRSYGAGLLNGPVSEHGVDIARLGIGTVALQAIHLSAVLGAREIHTVGFDMYLGKSVHWYEYPETYQPGRYFGEHSFVDYLGLKTTWQWIDTANYMFELEKLMGRDHVKWIDHSDGLLQRMRGGQK